MLIDGAVMVLSSYLLCCAEKMVESCVNTLEHA